MPFTEDFQDYVDSLEAALEDEGLDSSQALTPDGKIPVIHVSPTIKKLAGTHKLKSMSAFDNAFIPILRHICSQDVSHHQFDTVPPVTRGFIIDLQQNNAVEDFIQFCLTLILPHSRQVLSPEALRTTDFTRLIEQLAQDPNSAVIQDEDEALPALYLVHLFNHSRIAPDKTNARFSAINEESFHASYIGQTFSELLRMLMHMKRLFTASDALYFYEQSSNFKNGKMVILGRASVEIRTQHPLIYNVAMSLLESALVVYLGLLHNRTRKDMAQSRTPSTLPINTQAERLLAGLERPTVGAYSQALNLMMPLFQRARLAVITKRQQNILQQTIQELFEGPLTYSTLRNEAVRRLDNKLDAPYLKRRARAIGYRFVGDLDNPTHDVPIYAELSRFYSNPDDHYFASGNKSVYEVLKSVCNEMPGLPPGNLVTPFHQRTLALSPDNVLSIHEANKIIKRICTGGWYQIDELTMLQRRSRMRRGVSSDDWTLSQLQVVLQYLNSSPIVHGIDNRIFAAFVELPNLKKSLQDVVTLFAWFKRHQWIDKIAKKTVLPSSKKAVEEALDGEAAINYLKRLRKPILLAIQSATQCADKIFVNIHPQSGPGRWHISQSRRVGPGEYEVVEKCFLDMLHARRTIKYEPGSEEVKVLGTRI